MKMQEEPEVAIKQEDDQSLAVSHNDNRTKYICDSCDLTVFSRSGIRRHFRHKHLGVRRVQSKTEICTICGALVTKNNFKDHVKSHSNARDFICKLCGTAVKSIFTLRKHIRRLHQTVDSSTLLGNLKNVCKICDKQFSTPAAHRKHLLNYHSNNRNFTCEVCGKKSLTIGEHNRHITVHSEEKTFHCDQCDTRCTNSESLRIHLIKHKSEWAFKCGLCSKKFKHSSSVSGHRKLHKINGYYHCGCCDDRFTDYGQLRIHLVNSSHSFYSEETN